MEKNFVWALRLWVERRGERILDYISKFVGKNISGSNGLNNRLKNRRQTANNFFEKLNYLKGAEIWNGT